MSFSPTDTAVAAWKRQVDLSLKIAEAFVEGAEKAREIQLGAAVDAHAWLEATRKALEGANPGELVALQSRLATDNLAKMADYWNRLAANARDTQARIFKLLADSAPLSQPAVPQDALNEIIDAGYKQWIEALKRLYSLPRAEESRPA
jgi:hypothetical protein